MNTYLSNTLMFNSNIVKNKIKIVNKDSSDWIKNKTEFLLN